MLVLSDIFSFLDSERSDQHIDVRYFTLIFFKNGKVKVEHRAICPTAKKSVYNL